MEVIPTRTQALQQQVSRMRNEIIDLTARNTALEKENTLLSLLGPEAIARIQRKPEVFKRAGA